MTALIASLILYGTLCAATYYLVARAKVTSFLWRRYPRWLAYWTDCSACSGTWYALGWAFVGQHFNVSHLGLPGPDWFGYVLSNQEMTRPECEKWADEDGDEEWRCYDLH